MQLLFKREKEMSEEEKTKLSLMRALSVIFNPGTANRIFDDEKIFDFTSSSQKFAQASLLMDFFDIKVKSETVLRFPFPEKKTAWPGTVAFESTYIEKESSTIKFKTDYINNILSVFDEFEIYGKNELEDAKERKVKIKKND